MTEQFVIIGAGLAGAKAAETLRDEGFTGQIVLVGAEAVRPYERPPLSKGQLLGTAEPDAAFVHDAEWYAEHDVDLRTGVRATSIDRTGRTVTLDDGSTVAYDKLLITTGSSPRLLDTPGADLDGVLYLRTMPDREKLSAQLTDGARVVVLGGGWIGLEVAAAARSLGASVSLVETLPVPLQRVFGDEVGGLFQRLHEAHGVTFHTGASVRELRGNGAVSSVVLADGTELPADVVVVGVGIQPNISLAADAGVTTANGISVDAALRTSDPRIFAAGDVANAQHPLIGRPIRVEHWANALNGGPVAAKSMLGQDVAYDRLPYFFSDQYDLGMEYSGYVAPGGYDQMVFRGDPAGGEYVAFWLSDGCVLAGMNVNVWDVQDDIQRLVRAGFA
ncbi:MAG TPA: FAD-dependent oxidoreductase, partial [Micromonosporaceae bacterium]